LALARIAVLVVFIDDLQWADSVTLNLLHYAIRRWHDQATRVMLIINMRPEALLPMIRNLDINYPTSDQMNLSQWLTRVTRELTLVDIKLEPLGKQETIKLIQSILSPPALDFAQWLYYETRGQPFYLIETLKDLLERGVLQSKRHAEGRWVFALDAEHDLGQAVRVPSTVHAVICSRLYRLSPNAFSLLASAAVLEKQITFERLCAISKVTEDLALPALDELISGRLLLETKQPGNASTYPFVNDMLRDVVYTEAGDARRRLFHQRALEVLESAHESAAVLAHHAQAAGQVKAAFHYSLIAGQEALQISAVSEAIIHFERARQIIQDGLLPKRVAEADLQDLYMQLGRAYRLSSQLEKLKVLNAERDRIN
jgi:predicted ATPase